MDQNIKERHQDMFDTDSEGAELDTCDGTQRMRTHTCSAIGLALQGQPLDYFDQALGSSDEWVTWGALSFKKLYAADEAALARAQERLPLAALPFRARSRSNSSPGQPHPSGDLVPNSIAHRKRPRATSPSS